MPNTRRRRFSVQNDIAGRDGTKMQNAMQNRSQDVNDSNALINNLVSMRSSKSKNKIIPNSSKNTNNLEIVPETGSSTSRSHAKNRITNIDKNVTASSSNIDLFNIISVDGTPVEREVIDQRESIPKIRNARPANREASSLRRDKYPRQHRIKVRSPRRRMPVLDQKSIVTNKRSMGTIAIDWEQEVEVFVDHVTDFVETNERHCRVSNHSMDDMCRICHSGETLTSELGQLISACSCRGTVGRVHVKCLERWLTESGKSRCELCGTSYATRRVHRYGVLKALLMWVLSQNAKQLMVDSLGIMLMSPLAVLAAWLSGRTLAGLMAHDNHGTPWPLASTFVLACMTLVCYYCWIVSAATRHALGWWIWYRSQYEVRLQFQESEE